MAEKFLCIMAGYDADTSARLEALQQHLYAAGFTGTQTRDIPMHITLGTAAVEDEAAVAGSVRSAAAQTACFPVSFSHIGVFGGSRVLFVAPDVNRELLALRDHFDYGNRWAAHTTMLIDQPEAILSAVPHLARQFTPFQGRVTHIHLYEFFPARHILTVALNG